MAAHPKHGGAWDQRRRQKARTRWKGAANPGWKGGVTEKRTKGNYRGVRMVRCPDEWMPMARKDGYIMEHRLVMAKAVGRCLTRTEVVHHIDHDPSNNELVNLQLWMDNASHKRAEHGQFAAVAHCLLYPTASAQP